MNEEKLARKQGRIIKTEKKKMAKGSATLAGQISRIKTLRAYSGKRKRCVKIKI